jgi:hypothetical protein
MKRKRALNCRCDEFEARFYFIRNNGGLALLADADEPSSFPQ